MTSLTNRNCKRYRTVFAAVLSIALCSAPLGSETRRPGVDVELNPEKPLWLHVTLRSGVERTATIFRSELPWGYRYSMVFVAVRPSGKPVDMEMPVEDPVAQKVTLGPKASLTGDIDLRQIISNVDQVTHESEIHLFWAYKPPEVLHMPHWSGGWVLIPKQKS